MKLKVQQIKRIRPYISVEVLGKSRWPATHAKHQAGLSGVISVWNCDSERESTPLRPVAMVGRNVRTCQAIAACLDQFATRQLDGYRPHAVARVKRPAVHIKVTAEMRQVIDGPNERFRIHRSRFLCRALQRSADQEETSPWTSLIVGPRRLQPVCRFLV